MSFSCTYAIIYMLLAWWASHHNFGHWCYFLYTHRWSRKMRIWGGGTNLKNVSIDHAVTFTVYWIAYT